MSNSPGCPYCGAKRPDPRVVVDRETRCSKCGASFPDESGAWNPYAAPATSPAFDESTIIPEVPRSVLGKFVLAFRLLAGNLVLFGGVILTIWLPANVGLVWHEFQLPEGQDPPLIPSWNYLAGAILSPITVGALIVALAGRMEGRRVSYLEAMMGGFRNWGRLFFADIVAGMIVVLGLMAFVVPGIILQVRYALIDSVVVLEPDTEPRPRSSELTGGKGWKIFFAGLLYLTIYIPSAYGVSWALQEFELTDRLWVVVATDCLVDIVSYLSTIVMFLFYWEYRPNPELAPKPPSPNLDEMFGNFQMSQVGGRYP